MTEIAVTTVVSLQNPVLGDLMLDDSGDIVMLDDLAKEVAQRLWVSFQFFQGEWFKNLNAGTPYYKHVLVKSPKEEIVKAIFSQIITQTEGIASLDFIEYELDKPSRTCTITFSATLANGLTFYSSDYHEFVVDLT